MMSSEDLLPLSDVAIRLRIPYRTVYDLALRGRLGVPVRRGARLFIRRADLEAREARGDLRATEA